MAFSFVQSATYDSAGSTSAVITKPSGTADNDILFALLKHGTDEATSTSPSGWALLQEVFESGGGARWSLWWKLAASEGTGYTWTWATSSRTAGLMVAYRDGFDTADPIDMSSNTAYTTSNTTLRAAAMSVAAANSPLIFFGCVHASSANAIAPPTVPSTMTEDVEFFGGGGGRMNAQVASVVWSGSGSTGNMDATLTSATATKHAFAVSLNPPSGASYTLSVTPATLTPATQSVSLTLVGELNYTLVVNDPAAVTPSTQVVALSLATPVSNLVVTPVTSNIILSVTMPITRALCSPLAQSVALNATGQPNTYVLTVTPVSPTITPQDVALNPSYALSGSGTSYRQRRRVSYATRYFSRG